MNLDLHTHTSESDGQLTPQLLIKRAIKQKIEYLAITDHNTMNGVKKAQQCAKNSNLKVIPGVEISAGRTHIIGYFNNTPPKFFRLFLRSIFKKQAKEAKKTFLILQKEGYNIDYKKFMNQIKPKKMATDRDIAEGLSKRGYVEFKSLTEAAKTLTALKKIHIKTGEYDITPEQAISQITLAKGLPVLAHPFKYIKEKETIKFLIPKLVKIGLKGIEIPSKEDAKSQILFLTALAKKHNLFTTYGSDFHLKKQKLGTVIPNKTIQPFLKEANI